MSRRRSSIALAAVLAFGVPGAGAVGFGASQLATQLGGPLDFSVVVLLDPGETIPRECINAEVTTGDARLAGNQVLVLMQAGRSERQAVVRVGTSVGITEPVVSIEVTLGCVSPVSRKFIHLVDPPPIGTPSALPAAPPADAAAPGRRDSASEPAKRSRRAAPVPARRSTPTSTAPKDRPDREALRSERTAWAPDPAFDVVHPAPPVRRPASPLARWLARLLPLASAHASTVPARAADAPTGSLAGTPAPTAASASADTARLAELEAGLAQLRGDARATQQSVATLQARLREAESERYANPVVYGLTAIALAASVAAISALRRKDVGGPARPPLHDPALPDGAGSPHGDRTVARRAPSIAMAGEQATPQTNASSYTADDADDGGQSAAVATADAESTTPSELADLGRRSSERRLAEPPSSRSGPSTVSQPSTIGGLEVTTMLVPAPLARSREAANSVGATDATAGVTSAVEALLDLEQQVEFFTVLGQDAAAIDLLAAYIRDAGAEASPLPYLGLLALHARRDEAPAFERMRGLYEARFGVAAPEWGADPDASGGLEAQRAVLARLQALWPTPLQALPVLARLLFREGDGAQPFDHATYRELLFLYGVARELAEHVETDFGAIDLFLPLEDSAPPSTIVDALPTTPGGPIDLDLSEWPDDDPAELLQIVRSPGRRGAA